MSSLDDLFEPAGASAEAPAAGRSPAEAPAAGRSPVDSPGAGRPQAESPAGGRSRGGWLRRQAAWVWPMLRWSVAAAAGAVLLGGALALVLYALRVEMWYPLLPAGIFAVLVLRRAIAGLVPAPAVRARGAGRSEAGAQSDPDGLVPVVYRWVNRVRWERAGLWRSSKSLQPHLAELVDERLRQRYGCTRSSEPDRARRLLGDRLWRYLSDPSARTPPPRELAAMLTTVEEL